MYKKNFQNALEQYEKELMKLDFTIWESIIKVIVESTFNEDCVTYVDIIDKDTNNIEIHFSDCNFYEIQINKSDTTDEIKHKLLTNVVEERIIDMKSVGINRNNIRYLNNTVKL